MTLHSFEKSIASDILQDTIHNSPLESSIIHAADAKRKPIPNKEPGNLVVDGLVVGGHGSLLERLSKSRVGVTCACNIL
jgi:hypothetical protein